MSDKKRVHFAALGLAPGSHQAAWRHPNANPQGHVDVKFFRKVAEVAERGKFDMLFLADLLGPIGADHHSPEVFERQPYGLLEPMTLLAALSTYTSRLGLVATMSASVNTPWQVARTMGSLDLLSGGRAGWNVVTTPLLAQEDLRTTPLRSKEELYEHAREVTECAFDFWDSWRSDSFPRDPQGGTFVSLDGARVPGRQGKYYRLSGPLNQPRSPQGRPVIIQAGMSDIGRNLAAAVADVVFTVQPTIASAKAFYADMKERVAKAGRDPGAVLIQPGITPYVGRTRAEAQELHQQMLACIDPVASIGEIRYICGVDFSGCDLNGPVPDLEQWRATARNTGFFDVIDKVKRENPEISVIELLRALSSGRGHPDIVGNANDVADMIEQWVDEEACDGLLVQSPLLPDDLERFVDLVVPEVQRRGRFRTEYEHSTLRENLGLSIPG